MTISGMSRFFKSVFRFLRGLIMVAGVVAVLMLVLSFTSLPFWAYYRLGTASPLKCTPDFIVVMGAGGMPGAEGLMRCYYAAEMANHYPEAKVIIALPTLPEYFDESHTRRMYHEMVLRGVDSTRFMFEIKGTNTREQALNIAELTRSVQNACYLIITSPEHVSRSVKVFQKAGLMHTGGLPSFEQDLGDVLLLNERERKTGSISAQRLPSLRYNMWNYLKLEITVMREYTATLWYWIKGWI